jgi:translation initiation factor 1
VGQGRRHPLGGDARPVWSSDAGRRCPRCGWPAADCRCAATLAAAREEPVPAVVTARLRFEKKGRGGKAVTVVDGLPRNPAFVEALARDLKKALGTGGTAREAAVEIQGDRRDQLRELLAARGLRVKG